MDQEQADLRLRHNGRSRRHSVQEAGEHRFHHPDSATTSGRRTLLLPTSSKG
jgi:hypothetical protein